MGGEHVCTSCNQLIGMAHLPDCIRRTEGRANKHGTVIVDESDCDTTPDWVKSTEPPVGTEEGFDWAHDLNWEEALGVAKSQAYAALSTDPQNAMTRLVFAQTAQAFASIALVQKLEAPVQVMLHPDDDGYMDKLIKTLRDLEQYVPEAIERAIAGGIYKGRG